MPELPESLAPKGRSAETEELEYRTISYRSVAILVLILMSVAALVIYFMYPEAVRQRLAALLGSKNLSAAADMQQQQARFLNLDGNVRVKKANAVSWMNANLNMPLEKGDVVQTGPDGMARMSFADNTQYVMRADTLIVVEENAAAQKTKTTNVAVQVTSGTVDLATGKFDGESKVMIANAVARFRQDSRALVKNDPKSDVHEVLMTQGSAEVLRGTERLQLGQYERAHFTGDGPMGRERAMGPPLLISPANLTPLMVLDPKNYNLNFSWTAVPEAKAYRVRISTNSIFSTMVQDKRTKDTSLRVTGLPEGTYYWAVTSIGMNDKESENSDASKFTLVKQPSEKDEILLVIDDYIQQGKGLVIVGRTEPGARVMVNDEPVFTVNPDGSFKHFTSSQVKSGPFQITITAQNAKGKLATRRKTVYIE